MQTNYKRGRAKEYRIMEKLREEGFDVVTRSAGSHSAVDIIAVRRKDKRVKWIQCKPKSMSGNARQKICDEMVWLNDEMISTFEVI